MTIEWAIFFLSIGFMFGHWLGSRWWKKVANDWRRSSAEWKVLAEAWMHRCAVYKASFEIQRGVNKARDDLKKSDFVNRN